MTFEQSVVLSNDPQKMSDKGNEDDVSLQEDALLSEEHDHDDITERPTSDSDNVTVSILQSLNQLNTNMAAMGESLKLLHTKGETLTPTTAESARKRKSSSTRDDSETEKSDADNLLAANKRSKVAGNEINGSTCEDSAGYDEGDSLLDDIAQSLTDMEKTAPKVSEKLAKIVNLRWLKKLDDTHLKEKSEKYLRPVNCDRLITPKVNPEIWGRLDRQTRGKDLRLSSLQATLTKVGNITAQTTNLLLKARAENRKLDLESMIE